MTDFSGFFVGRGQWVDLAAAEFNPIRASGPGGQNVNKVSSACELRFDVAAARLPGEMADKLLILAGTRASKDGVIVIKAQRFRDLERNKADAVERLKTLCEAAIFREKKRIATRPTRASQTRRLAGKARDSDVKRARRAPPHED